MKAVLSISKIGFAAVAVMLSAMAVVTSCSPNKNNAATRNYQAFITRYNIYYNGDTHYKETLETMESGYEDDFSRLLYAHPAEAREESSAPQPTGDFTRSIEKAQKAIQVRSIKKKPARKPGQNNSAEYKAWLRRDEYNPFMHNAWMMMGRSQFMNSDFLGAASTFYYISKHFTWLPQTVTEAQIWQARSYVALGWLFEGETILKRIKPAEFADNKTLRHLYNVTYADFDIRSKDYAGAIEHLKEAVATASGPQKYRLNFLLGQVYALEGRRAEAYKAFEKAAKNSSAPYRVQFNARIKQSEVYEGDDIMPEVNALKRMTRYDRNKQYLDQIYYAIGNLYLSVNDTVQAMSNYAEAIDKSKRGGIDKALAQLTLGGLYYERGDYAEAQPLYAEAMPVIPDTYADYKMLQRRSDYLDRLAVYAQNVTLQDSLLKLSYLTPEEQTAVAERLIEELNKREAEEAERARREELLAEANSQANPFGDNGTSPSTFTMGGDDSWYFYNKSTVTAGKTDFQRRWGSRKLEDDWRRRNKSVAIFMPTEDEDDEADVADTATGAPDGNAAIDLDAMQRENDPHYVEYYLKQIPKDDAERAVCNDVIQEGLYNMGLILKDDLRDFAASRHEFDRLLTRYPDNIYRLDVYYNLYLMAAQSGDVAMAEHWRQMIVSEFADSPLGQAMTDPKYLDNLRAMEQRQEQLYEQAYNDYLENKNVAVHKAYQEMKKDFPMSPIMPKFMFIDALAYVTERNTDEFKSTLTELLERYPDADVAPYASAYMRGLSQGRELQAGVSNMRGMLWDIRLTNDSTMTGNNEIEFALDPESRQMLVLLYPTDKVSANQLLYDVARVNFTSFAVRDFDLEQMNFGRLGMLIIQPFDNLRQLNRYIAVLADNPTVQLPRDVRPVIISRDDFDTLLQNGASFDDYFRYTDEHNYLNAQQNVLPEHLFGEPETLDEAEQAAAERQSEPVTSGETGHEATVASPANAMPVMPSAELPDDERYTDVQPAAPSLQPDALQPAMPQQEVEPQNTIQSDSANQSTAISQPSGAVQPAGASQQSVSKPDSSHPEQPSANQATRPMAAPQAPVSQPATGVTKPTLPTYPAGSEGDDDDLL